MKLWAIGGWLKIHKAKTTSSALLHTRNSQAQLLWDLDKSGHRIQPLTDDDLLRASAE